jgi:hypothetical protein
VITTTKTSTFPEDGSARGALAWTVLKSQRAGFVFDVATTSVRPQAKSSPNGYNPAARRRGPRGKSAHLLRLYLLSAEVRFLRAFAASLPLVPNCSTYLSVKTVSFQQMKRQEARIRMSAVRKARHNPQAAAAQQRRASLVGGGASWRIINLNEVALAIAKGAQLWLFPSRNSRKSSKYAMRLESRIFSSEAKRSIIGRNDICPRHRRSARCSHSLARH